MRIAREEDVERWLASSACQELLAFLKRIGGAMQGKRNSQLEGIKAAEQDILAKLNGFLAEVEGLIEQVEPLPMAKGRYGNKAFRLLFEKMNEIQFEPPFAKELLCRSFGNETRIDYGTGHELFFLVACLVVVKAEGLSVDGMSEDLAALLGAQVICGRYLKVVRAIQARYSLEPAGSHGVWGLDDYQFLPFLLGAAQLIGLDEEVPTGVAVEPSVFYGPQAEEFIYLRELAHVHRLKTRGNASLAFAHHSPLLHSISGVASWERIRDGLGRMYCKEVLGKFPVVQHLIFDDQYFQFT